MRPDPTRRALLSTLTLATLLLAGAPAVEAQIGALRRAAERAAERVVDPARLLEGRAPITTSIADATFGVEAMDGFSPDQPDGRRLRLAVQGLGITSFGGAPVDSLDALPAERLPRSALRQLTELERTPSGGFLLLPGYFEMHVQSYCLHAGTHGPGGGDGYLHAPPLGSAEDAVVSILRNSVARPDIPQQQIQQLLWAIVARAKFEDLRPDLKPVAAQLLTPRELATLNRGALDYIPGPAFDRALQGMPRLVQQILRAEAELRQMLTSANSTFNDMERVAVLAGVAPLGEGSREVSAGRWSRHPDGYYVRYLPRGYSHTLIQVWVPEGSPAVGRELDLATQIAVPGNTARQRLIQSGRGRPAG
jgi:hypothetical protein